MPIWKDTQRLFEYSIFILMIALFFVCLMLLPHALCLRHKVHYGFDTSMWTY